MEDQNQIAQPAAAYEAPAARVVGSITDLTAMPFKSGGSGDCIGGAGTCGGFPSHL
jgi:hypothetical protein